MGVEEGDCLECWIGVSTERAVRFEAVLGQDWEEEAGENSWVWGFGCPGGLFFRFSARTCVDYLELMERMMMMMMGQ